MMNCGGKCDCGTNHQKEGPEKDNIQQIIEEIQSMFKKEIPAVNWVSDHDTYLFMLSHAPFYVSGIHCKDDDVTWWAAAENKEAYDKWEDTVEHQHHPQEVHEHYLCNNPGLEY